MIIQTMPCVDIFSHWIKVFSKLNPKPFGLTLFFSIHGIPADETPIYCRLHHAFAAEIQSFPATNLGWSSKQHLFSFASLVRAACTAAPSASWSTTPTETPTLRESMPGAMGIRSRLGSGGFLVQNREITSFQWKFHQLQKKYTYNTA